LDAPRPGDGLQPGRGAPAVDVDFPHLLAVAADAPRVDVDDGGAGAELAGAAGDEVGVADGTAVDADPLGAGPAEPGGVVECADGAADGEGHEDRVGDAAYHVEEGGAALVAGADVEEDQLVGALLVVATGDVHGVAGVAQADEVDALDHAATV